MLVGYALINQMRVDLHKQASNFSLACAGKFIEGQKPWKIEGAKYDIAMPCATQNEIDQSDAEALVKAGVKYVLEGANMPTETTAISVFHKNNIIFAPGKVCFYQCAIMLVTDAQQCCLGCW